MDDAAPLKQGIGAPLRRREDQRLLTGKGDFTGDRVPAGVCYAAMVRSPHAHAHIRSIEFAAAAAAEGVIAVFTGADLLADKINPIPHEARWSGSTDVELDLRGDRKVYTTDHYAMPPQTVRFIGEAVAMVVAETPAAAADAAELVEVDYDVLPAVARAVDALREGAPQIWPGCEGNVSLDGDVGDPAATEAAFARAAHVTRLETWIQRVTGSPMERRTAIGYFDPEAGQYAVQCGSGGGVVRIREQLAGMLGEPLENCRVFCGDMGGNFGTRNTFAPEYGLLPWAARKLGRPVKWEADRTECFLTDYQGRDLTVEAELALDAEGNFIGLRGSNTSNIGAYTAHFTPLRKGLGIMQGVYNIPAVHFRGRAVFTNTVPTTPYRSAGRPEAIYIIERLVDMAADEHGFDPVELRRRNLIRPEAMPFANAVGLTYDNGEYELGMDTALDLADWKGFPARRAEAKRRGKLRGIGIANYIEGTGGAPRERAEVTVEPSGEVELVLGTMNSGQGHETSFAQLLNEWLGVPVDNVRYVAHDTARVSAGGGSHSGRSMRIASLAIGEAADKIVARGKQIAAHLLQARAEDLGFADGRFTAGDGGASMGLFEVAQAADSNDSLPAELRGPLAEVGDVTVGTGAWPSGCHICEVEIDPDTGHAQLVAWAAVDDVGLAVNPFILEGQTYGAVAQGVGQALVEDIQYDPQSGQMMAASFMDYAMPHAELMPPIKCRLIEVPATSHRYGIRPGGEGGTTPALGVVINAIVDALSELGVRHVEMPATPERIWRAIEDAKNARAG